jgi:hypothetical protein
LVPKTFKLFGLPFQSFMSVPDEGFSRNVLCTPNYIYTFLLDSWMKFH